MNDYACQVVPVYVYPSPLTDEKACIGVIVRCRETGFAGYRLVENGTPSFERIATFLPRLGRDGLLRVLEWAVQDIEYSILCPDREIAERRFANLIRPRENVIQYGGVQLHCTQSPSDKVDRAFHDMVA